LYFELYMWHLWNNALTLVVVSTEFLVCTKSRSQQLHPGDAGRHCRVAKILWSNAHSRSRSQAHAHPALFRFFVFDAISALDDDSVKIRSSRDPFESIAIPVLNPNQIQFANTTSTINDFIALKFILSDLYRNYCTTIDVVSDLVCIWVQNIWKIFQNRRTFLYGSSLCYNNPWSVCASLYTVKTDGDKRVRIHYSFKNKSWEPKSSKTRLLSLAYKHYWKVLINYNIIKHYGIIFSVQELNKSFTCSVKGYYAVVHC